MNTNRFCSGRIKWLNLAGWFCLLLWAPLAAFAQSPAFEADAKLTKNARTWAEEFVTFAADRYKVELDWTQVSIKYIDEIVDDLHKTYLAETPEEQLVAPIGRALGSYVAEVYRIYYGGQWGWIELEAGSFPGVRSQSGADFFPLKKALDRIKTGDDPDIWEYFQLLSDQ